MTKLINSESLDLFSQESIEELKDEFGSDVKIEWNIIPDERESRSEQIMNCRTLLDEVTEFAKVTEFELTDTIKDKVYSIQESEVMV